MTDRERVIKLIKNSKENDLCDFKRTFYHKNKYGDMIKDIAAFANNTICDDKYIIFNIDDETHEVGPEKIENVPDISVINELIRGHVEPYINVELSEFLYENSNVVYIKILKENMDRPYLIKKEKGYEGKIFINQGDIFVRKDATNFKANREDLDKIYDAREKRNVIVESKEICAKEFCVDNVIHEIFMLQFRFENNSKYNFLLDDVKLKLSIEERSFLLNCEYMIVLKDGACNKAVRLKETQYSILPYYTDRNVVGFHITDTYLNKVKSTYGQYVTVHVNLIMKDVNGNTIVSEEVACNLVLG